MKKRLIALLFISSSILNADTFQPLSQSISQPSLHTRQLQMRYNRLRNDYKWYLSDLYYAIKPNVSSVYHALCEVPNTMLHTVIGHHAHEQQDALVRFTDHDELGPAEKIYLAQRAEKTHNGLERFLGTSVDKETQPRIAMCFSGGGIRATILTLGFLIGASCRWFNVPLPAPPKLLGALLVATMTVGYLVTGHFFS